jgi:Zn-dependent protease
MVSLLFQNPIVFAAWVLAILVALSVHEFSHALVSTTLGDPTAKRLGRLTLNPAAHVDLLGLLALVTVGFGWGKPVPYNAYNLRNQKWGPVLIALAGPAMNLVLALGLGLLVRVLLPMLGDSNLLIQFLYLSLMLNLSLMLFNLLPIPPLDGSKILLTVLSGPQAARTRIWLETRGPWLLIGLVVADAVLGLGVFDWLYRVMTALTNLIVGV